jgi:hypothetical protein
LFVAERILTDPAQRLAPFVDEPAKGTFGGAVADKARFVLELNVVC